jgi:hypothetical protein
MERSALSARFPLHGDHCFKITADRGGTVSAMEYGRPCHGVGSAMTPPELPILDPPYSTESVLMSSR